jgi:hypothetical protein
VKPKDPNPGGRPINYLKRCIVMEVQLQRRCCQRTAEHYLNKFNLQYVKLLREHPAKCLNDWHRLTEFDKGRYYGILESELADMKEERGLT